MRDHPRLTARWPSFPKKQNKALVLDPMASQIHKIKSSLLYKHHGSKNLFWVVKEGVLKDKNREEIPCEVIECKTWKWNKKNLDLNLDLEDLRKKLWEKGFHSLLIEGGAYTLSSFFEQEVLQRFYLHLSPLLLGRTSALSWSEHLQIPSLKEALSMELSSCTFLSPDISLSYKLRARKNGHPL